MADTFLIEQNSDYDALITALVGNDEGLSNIRVSEIARPQGDAGAYGTFADDPFDLQSGIVLSTGNVEDLKGPNLEDGGRVLPQSTTLNFEKLGTVNNNTDIFVADLSQVGFDIQSIEILDSGSGIGGGTGSVSGFDLDAIKISEILLDAADVAEINDGSVLPGKDVFNFDAEGTIVELGTQRPPIATELNGTTNGIVDDEEATLDIFDADRAISGAFSLGDGGKVKFNLIESVSASDTPVYLYVGEGGDTNSGENLEGLISVSDQRATVQSEPKKVNLTIEFEADTSIKDTLYFQYVFGSEEFIEYVGNGFNDSFEILLNGTNIAKLSDGGNVNINQLGSDPNPLNPDGNAFHPDFIYNPAIDSPLGPGPASDVLTLDGFTRTLLAEGSLQEGPNVLEIIVEDVRDGNLPSAVFLEEGTFGTTKPDDIENDGTDGGNSDNPDGPGNPEIPNSGTRIPELLDLTANSGDVTISVTLTREADCDNILQFYKTDENGKIGNISLTDVLYEQAVVDELLGPALYVEDRGTRTVNFTLPGGAHYAPALLINGDLNNLATIQDAARGQVQIQRNSTGWWFEDATDNDFDDLIVKRNLIEPLTL